MQKPLFTVIYIYIYNLKEINILFWLQLLLIIFSLSFTPDVHQMFVPLKDKTFSHETNKEVKF